MTRGVTGSYVTLSKIGGEVVRGFIPAPLPPKPPLDIGPDLRDRLDAAILALGRLDSVTNLLPDSRLLLYSYVRKEAVLSSQIEGTQSSLSDLLLFEADELPGVPIDDVLEVSNYVDAMEHGLRRLRDGFPLSNRLIREVHERLLTKGRGADKDPGHFRRTQNWLGGSRPGNAVFVPAPPEHVSGLMSDLERWLHDEHVRTPPLLKAALGHVQFETIHPFLDGNGRVGRLLITLVLCAEDVLHEPLLYLSLYLKQHRAQYYDLLDRVRRDGDWEAWLAFFAEGVRETAEGAVKTVQRLMELSERDRERIRTIPRRASTALQIQHSFQERPIANASTLAERCRISTPTVYKGLDVLQSLGIVREITGRKRGRLFAYETYLGILSEGTEPL